MITKKIIPGKLTWSESKNTAANLSTGNHKDWRLPTTDELKVIYQITNICGINYNTDSFWASENPHDNLTGKWLVDFKNSGEVYCKPDDLKFGKGNVFCVR